MIVARKNALIDRLLYLYFRRLAGRTFHTVAARGLEHLRDLPGDRPALLFCTHTNWWDGLIAYFLTRHMPGKAGYCMMEEKQLRQFRFFTRLGAFSVDLTSPARAAVSLRYARGLLSRDESAVWIFPQGKLCRPNEPFVARPGAAYLARRTPRARLVPVALRYEFFREDRPHVLIEIGAPFTGEGLTEGRIAAECGAALERATRAAAEQDITGFHPLFPARWPVNKRWEWVRRAATGRLEGFDPAN